MDSPSFHVPRARTVLDALFALPPSGKVTHPKMPHACGVCNRNVQPLARVVYPGVLVCEKEVCRVVRFGSVTQLFQTPYGRALGRNTIAIFTHLLDLPSGRTVVEIQPVLDRAEILVQGYLDLLAWQKAFDIFERSLLGDDYRLGRVTLIPPRRLEDVLSCRALSMPTPVDPTVGLSDEIREKLHLAKTNGRLDIPF